MRRVDALTPGDRGMDTVFSRSQKYGRAVFWTLSLTLPAGGRERKRKCPR
jgi:hypothetical protein